MITWRDNDWIAVGTRVRLTHRPDGEVISWHPRGDEPEDQWPRLLGGARGVVVAAPRYGAPPHPCPNHDEGIDDCACGRESGVVPARLPMASVDWELDDGSTLRSGLRYPGTGGRAWELVDDAEAMPCEPTDRRDLVVFESALVKGEPITHATLDGETTLCGRRGWETREGWSDIGPDCLRCARALSGVS